MLDPKNDPFRPPIARFRPPRRRHRTQRAKLCPKMVPKGLQLTWSNFAGTFRMTTVTGPFRAINGV